MRDVLKAFCVAAASALGLYLTAEALRRIGPETFDDTLESWARRTIADARDRRRRERIYQQQRGRVVWDAMEAARLAAEGTDQ